MSSSPETQPQESNQPQHPRHHHPHVTFTFPISFVFSAPTPPASENASPPYPDGDGGASASPQPGQPQAQAQFPPEALQHLFAHFLRAMPHVFMSGPPTQFEPMPNAPPKKHATQSALDRLKDIDPLTLAETDRRCNICMQDYWVKPVGPRSPYVEDVTDEDDFDQVLSAIDVEGLTDQMEDVIPEVNEVKEPEKPADAEVPVQMPCGHIFGSTCLKEWLYQSPTCPLCRVEVESYVEEPAPQPAFPFVPQPQSQNAQTAQPNNETQIPPPPPQFAFQFIFTAPPPSPTGPPEQSSPSPTPTPNISRPGTSHSIRHHPYARASPSTVQARPDLFCAQRQSGLCSHDDEAENTLLRLDCGHAFHPECLDGAMLVEGYPPEGEERRCPRCRRWGRIINF